MIRWELLILSHLFPARSLSLPSVQMLILANFFLCIMQHFADFTFFQVSLIKNSLTLTSVVDRQRFDADRIRNFILSPIQIRIRMRILPQVLHMMESWRFLLFTSMPVYNVFPFLISGLCVIISVCWLESILKFSRKK
jgi:hypothetical protein